MKKNITDFIRRNLALFAFFGALTLIAGFFLFQDEKPTSLNGMLRQGERYTSEGKLSLALEYYTRIVRIYPESYKAHIELGNLLLQVKESEMAKVEYYRAMKLDNSRRYDAYFAMTEIYISENNYDFAQKLLMVIKDVPNRGVIEQIGDFYYKWGNSLIEKDELEAVRKYKEAINFYEKINSDHIKKAQRSIDEAYARISNKFVSDNKKDEAIKILELSVDFDNNELAHYKLARIYANIDINKAINEYEKAFNQKSPYLFDKSEFIHLLVKKGDMAKDQGDNVLSAYYYNKVKSLEPKSNIPYITDKHLIITVLAVRYNENLDDDIITPGISFKIMNVSKNPVKNLKVKVAFFDDNKLYSETIQTIADSVSLMEPDAVTNAISIFSQKPVPQVFSTHNINARIFLSQDKIDKWKLYRTVYLKKPEGSVRMSPE